MNTHTCTNAHTLMHTYTDAIACLNVHPGLTLASLASTVRGKATNVFSPQEWGYGRWRKPEGVDKHAGELECMPEKGAEGLWRQESYRDANREYFIVIILGLFLSLGMHTKLWRGVGSSRWLAYCLWKRGQSVVEKSFLPKAFGEIIPCTGLRFKRKI